MNSEAHDVRTVDPRLWLMLFSIIALVSVVNVAYYTWQAAIPLPASDAWYFLQTFVAGVLDDGLTFSELFIQRGVGGDHAQPLQKLILLGHLWGADLDFRIEAMVGVIAALLACTLLCFVLLRCGGLESPKSVLGACAIMLVGLSLNATALYTWSLVTLGWWMVFAALVYWRVLASTPTTLWQSACLSLFATFTMAVLLDELAIPVVLALLLARAIGDPHGTFRGGSLGIIGGALSGLVVARLLIHCLSPVAEGAGMAFERVAASVGGWAGLWGLLGGPLADSLVHASHFPSGAVGDFASSALVITIGLAHCVFWWRVLVSRRLPAAPVRTLAIAMMLMFYATVAGVAVSRVPDFGVDYVHQPRYVLFYQLSVLAWILLFAAPSDSLTGKAGLAASATQSRWRLVAVGGALLVLGLNQVWLSYRAWEALPYQRAYVVNALRVVEGLAANNEVPMAGCPDILTICDAPVDARAAVFGLLQQHKLNLFSDAFRHAHGFDALASTIPIDPLVSSARCAAAVLDWGPRVIRFGEAFNVQPDGRSAYWVQLTPDVIVDSVLIESGEVVPFALSHGLLSFLQTSSLEAMVDKKQDFSVRLQCSGGGETMIQIAVEP